jgi:hypothetical protein
MKIKTARKYFAIFIISLFLAGTTQIGLSISGNTTELVPQTAETRTSFDPFMEGWTCRKQITIDHTKVAGDVTDFPVLISITDASLQTKAQMNGDDILFMDGIGIAQQLNHEIETYDSSSGKLVAWVNLPSLTSTTDKIFYMYYGNPESNSQQNQEATWNSNYLAVWHLNNNPTGLILDSSTNKNNGDPQGGMTASDLVDGKTGLCLDFDGVDDSISFEEFTDTQDMGTCVAWVQTTMDDIGAVWAETQYDSLKPYIVCGKYYDDVLWFARDVYGLDSNFQGRKPIGMNDGQWHQVVWVSNGEENGNMFFFDGEPISLTWQDNQDPDGIWFNDQETDTHSIAAFGRYDLDYPWDGFLDEIRLMNIPTSAEMVATEYANQNNPSSFYTIGLEEEIPLKTTIMFGKISNVSSIGDFTRVDAVKLRFIQFSPFSFNTYTSNERILVSNDYLGIFTQKMILAIGQAYN